MSRITVLLIGFALFAAPLLVAEQVPYDGARSLHTDSSIEWIEFDVQQDALYEVKAASVSFSPVVRVERDGGTTNTLRPSGNSILHRQIISGSATTVRLGVAGSNEHGGNYLLSVDRVSVGSSIRVGDTRDGTLDGGDQRGARGLVDWYRLPLDKTGPIEVWLRSEDFDSAASGDYDLSVRAVEPNESISPGQTLSGLIRDGDMSSEHLYRVQGEPGTPVVVKLESTDFDTVLHVSSPERGRMTNDDVPGGASTNSHMFFRLGESGSALIRVARFERKTGLYPFTRRIPRAGNRFDPPRRARSACSPL